MDMPLILFDVLLPVIFLLLLTAAAVLWIRTRHTAALVQFIACAISFVLVAVEALAKYLYRAEKPQLLDFINAPTLQVAVQITFLLCFVAFPLGYLWHALGQKRI